MEAQESTTPQPGSPKDLAHRLGDRIGPYLQRAQTVAAVVAFLALVLGFLASIGVRLLPQGGETAAWVLHAVLLLIGAAGGLATAIRGRQVDEKRWELLDDPMMTSGERELAHREAERERRWASTVFFVMPILLGYWWANLLSGEDGGSLLTFLLTASPMIGFLVGLFLTQRALGPEKKPY